MPQSWRAFETVRSKLGHLSEVPNYVRELIKWQHFKIQI